MLRLETGETSPVQEAHLVRPRFTKPYQFVFARLVQTDGPQLRSLNGGLRTHLGLRHGFSCQHVIYSAPQTFGIGGFVVQHLTVDQNGRSAGDAH